jgi:uncharacterized protein (DUF58 family)
VTNGAAREATPTFSRRLRRLNHVLIPKTKAGRDRFRKSLGGKLARPAIFLYESLSAEGGALALASLFAAAFGFEVRATEAYVLWSGVVAVLAASLLVTRAFALSGVRVSVQCAKRVTVGDEMTFTVTLANTGGRAHGAVRAFGPFLPWDGEWTAGTAEAGDLPTGATRALEMRARFVERGEHHLDSFRAAALVPFGLSLGPPRRTGGCRFLVVPKIANVTQVTTPLGTRHQPGGVALASKTGESMELLGVRPYRPGDPVRDLHARTWGRHGVPAVREYQQEYFSRIGVVLDTDRTVTDDEERLEAAVSLAAGIVHHLSRGEALIDLLVVGGVVHTLTLGRSLGTFEQALDLLACVSPGPSFSTESLMAELAPHLPRLSCLVVVALAWDEKRASLAARVRASGVGTTSYVVDVDAHGDHLRKVDAGAITRGEALSL